MEIYIVTFLVLYVFSFLELRVNLSVLQHKSMSVFVYFLLIFQVGLRWQTGTDWDSYLLHFKGMDNISDVYLFMALFEPGYSFFVLAVKYLWNSYTVFFVVHALVYYALVFSAFKKLSPYLFISLLVFYATTMGVLGSNRQLIALGICLYALRYVIEKNAIKFFLLIAIAYLFHVTAIIFIIYYFLNRDIKQFWVFAILILSFIIGKTSIPLSFITFIANNIGGMASSKALHYIDIAEDDLLNNSLSVLGFIKRFLFIGLFIYNYKFLTSKLTYYKLIFNGYVVGLVLYFLFSSSILLLVNRGSLYFSAMEVLLLSSQFLVLKNKDYKVILLFILFIISIFLFFQSIAGYADLFIPYKGIFINTDFKRFRLD